jgi:lipopolysaccharide transport system ATP-binding protein
MSFDAVSVENLGKCYRIYARPQDRLIHSVVHRLRMLSGRTGPVHRASAFRYQEFWALKNVSFNVAQGETVGIIGRNGSGKSTLLQLICGTLTPTIGSVRTRGRIAALLELGAGFNPEFTGRENVYLNATVLGLSHDEIDCKFSEIAAFADIGHFIEQPVKHYSSGMYARLAFAVAISVDPDILVVDEALAVGDEAFQRKCFARINEIKQSGAAILFVSHSSATVIDLCDRALLLHRGERLFTGVPKKVVFYSQKLGNASSEDTASIADEIRAADYEEMAVAESMTTSASERSEHGSGPGDTPEAHPSSARVDAHANEELQPILDTSLQSKSVFSYEPNGARIFDPRLVTTDGTQVNQIVRGGRYLLRCEVSFDRSCQRVRFYALIRTMTGIDLAGCVHPLLSQPGMDMPEGALLSLAFGFSCILNPATYFCNFAVQGNDSVLHHRIVDALAFRVVTSTARPATGLIDVDFKIQLQHRAKEAAPSDWVRNSMGI